RSQTAIGCVSKTRYLLVFEIPYLIITDCVAAVHLCGTITLGRNFGCDQAAGQLQKQCTRNCHTDFVVGKQAAGKHI
ncbi:MAG: hypothetical protein M3R17_10205, partial [Bacteroidota bacterium]|nr:hypothetical protein [Bacteroidota bacterium]